MTFSIEFGWWLLPLAVTVLAYGAHFYTWWGHKPAGDYGVIGDSFAQLLTFLLASVVTLVAWLIYAVLT